MKKNRVKCDVKNDAGAMEKKTYDLENSDHFWTQNQTSSFPEVAQHIQDSLAEYQKAREEVFLFSFLFFFVRWIVVSICSAFER
jgi:hypothetical protein